MYVLNSVVRVVDILFVVVVVRLVVGVVMVVVVWLIVELILVKLVVVVVNIDGCVNMYDKFYFFLLMGFIIYLLS